MNEQQMKILPMLCEPIMKYLANFPQAEVCISGDKILVKQIIGGTESPHKRRMHDGKEQKSQKESECNIGGGIG